MESKRGRVAIYKNNEAAASRDRTTCFIRVAAILLYYSSYRFYGRSRVLLKDKRISLLLESRKSSSFALFSGVYINPLSFTKTL